MNLPEYIKPIHIERFWSRVDKRGRDECWEWQGGKSTCNTRYTPMTYGSYSIHHQGRQITIRAHRFAWIITYGMPAKGLVVCHECDNPLCVNLDHLFLATRAQNQRDMQRKLRSGILGEKNPKAKITPDIVRAIRLEPGSPSEIGRKYGLHPHAHHPDHPRGEVAPCHLTTPLPRSKLSWIHWRHATAR